MSAKGKEAKKGGEVSSGESKRTSKNEDCNKKLREQEDKFLKLQAQYRQLYDEYALFRQRAQNREKEAFMDWFDKLAKVMIKMIEDLHKAMVQMPQDIKNSNWGKGLETLIKQFEDMIKKMDIYIEDALGKQVDHIYHEPIWVEQVDDKSQKGKVIKQYERWYIYKKWTSEEKVLQPAKVIVWQ